ncbi:hypothetical protein BLFGPEAP_02725 [Candidatus Methanoperedenaceae archaeon GB50]|nr:hypothetical protein BLFGPEAP_02725 [Candidatus Methanoperedenaceae archaeon GB50]
MKKGEEIRNKIFSWQETALFKKSWAITPKKTQSKVRGNPLALKEEKYAYTN